MIRTLRTVGALASITLLLTACTSTDVSTTTESNPTAIPDKMAIAACTIAARASGKQKAGEQLPFILDSTSAAHRAAMSSDPAIQEAGRRLLPVGLQAGELLVKKKASTVEMKPVLQQLGGAQRDLVAACTELYGPTPWPFDNLPSTGASR